MLNKDFIAPGLVIYLDIPVENALDRINKRNGIPEIFEKKEILKKVKGTYDYIFSMIPFQHIANKVLIIDGLRNQKDISEKIVRNLIGY